MAFVAVILFGRFLSAGNKILVYKITSVAKNKQFLKIYFLKLVCMHMRLAIFSSVNYP